MKTCKEKCWNISSYSATCYFQNFEEMSESLFRPKKTASFKPPQKDPKFPVQGDGGGKGKKKKGNKNYPATPGIRVPRLCDVSRIEIARKISLAEEVTQNTHYPRNGRMPFRKTRCRGVPFRDLWSFLAGDGETSYWTASSHLERLQQAQSTRIVSLRRCPPQGQQVPWMSAGFKPKDSSPKQHVLQTSGSNWLCEPQEERVCPQAWKCSLPCIVRTFLFLYIFKMWNMTFDKSFLFAQLDMPGHEEPKCPQVWSENFQHNLHETQQG